MSRLRATMGWMGAVLLAFAPVAATATGPALPDTLVTTDAGRQLHFLTELVGQRTAVIDFMYTDCEGLCPLQGRNFGVLARALGSRLNRDVVLISVSLSPIADTPARLRVWKQRFSPAEGWTCVTGDAAALSDLVRALRRREKGPGAHDGTVVILRPATGAWSEIGGLAGPDDLVRQINSIAARPL